MKTGRLLSAVGSGTENTRRQIVAAHDAAGNMRDLPVLPQRNEEVIPGCQVWISFLKMHNSCLD